MDTPKVLWDEVHSCYSWTFEPTEMGLNISVEHSDGECARGTDTKITLDIALLEDLLSRARSKTRIGIFRVA